MKRLVSLSLGVLAAVGGFVDMGGIITSTQAGAQYRFGLIWTLIPGIIGFAVYADMAGRVAVASGRTLFDVIRDRLGARLALIPLFSSILMQVLTLFVELAGMTLVLQLATKLSYLLWIPVATLLLGLILWKVSFEVMDNSAALVGLAMLVAVVVMIRLAPPWGQIGEEVLHPQLDSSQSSAGYLFSVISLLGAYMTPYQFYFYSSGALEEEWEGKDLLTNRVVALVGTGFGAIITLALMVVGAMVLYPQHLQVNSLEQAAQPFQQDLGTLGLILFLVGTFAVSLGAGLECALSGTYSICQYCGWDWGKKGKPRQAPLFHLFYIVMLVLAMLLAYTGVDPIKLTTFTMAIGAVSLPFTFLPLLIIANDPEYVGDQKNNLAINVVSVVMLLLLVGVTLSALPLLLLSGGVVLNLKRAEEVYAKGESGRKGKARWIWVNMWWIRI